MHEVVRALRIIAALMLIAAGLGLLGALVHTESATYGPAVAKARPSNIHTVPKSNSGLKHSRHS